MLKSHPVTYQAPTCCFWGLGIPFPPSLLVGCRYPHAWPQRQLGKNIGARWVLVTSPTGLPWVSMTVLPALRLWCYKLQTHAGTGAALAVQCCLVYSAAEREERSSSPPPTTPSPLHPICICLQRFSADLVSEWAPVLLSALRTGAFHYDSAKQPTEIRDKIESILQLCRLFRLHYNSLLWHVPNYIFLHI